MLDGHANRRQLFRSIGDRFAPAGEIKSLADPLGDGHAASSRYALDFPVVRNPAELPAVA